MSFRLSLSSRKIWLSRFEATSLRHSNLPISILLWYNRPFFSLLASFLYLNLSPPSVCVCECACVFLIKKFSWTSSRMRGKEFMASCFNAPSPFNACYYCSLVVCTTCFLHFPLLLHAHARTHKYNLPCISKSTHSVLSRSVSLCVSVRCTITFCVLHAKRNQLQTCAALSLGFFVYKEVNLWLVRKESNECLQRTAILSSWNFESGGPSGQ